MFRLLNSSPAHKSLEQPRQASIRGDVTDVASKGFKLSELVVLGFLVFTSGARVHF
jgi:hypothetical protein